MIEFKTVINEETSTDEPIYSHYIDRGEDPRPAWTLILEARINGTPIAALCGYIWVPSRNPMNHPVCPKCEEMLGFAMSFRGVGL